MAAVELKNTSLFNDANLVSYWRFEGNSNDSKSSNNGSDTSITYSSGNGMFGQGAGLNGTTSQIDIGSGVSLHQAVYTISAWVNPSGNTVRPILSLGGEGSPCLRINANNTLTLTHVGVVDIGSSIGTIPNGSWSLVEATYSAGAWKIYINGSLDNSGTNSQTQNFAHNGLIGRDGTVSSNFYNGNIDDLALFSRVLTAQEISDLFTGADATTTSTTTTTTSTSTSTTTTSTSTTTTSTSTTTTTSTSTTTTSTSTTRTVTTTSTTTTSTSTTRTTTSTTTSTSSSTSTTTTWFYAGEIPSTATTPSGNIEEDTESTNLNFTIERKTEQV